MTRHRKNLRTGQRGAAVVESALITPLFLLLVFGIIEVAAFLFDLSQVGNAARDGAREVSVSARDAVADRNAIVIARRSLGTATRRVEAMIVFKASTPTDAVPPGCLAALDAGSRGVDGLCNIYRTAEVSSADITGFGAEATASCATAPLKWDQCWPPTGRNDRLGNDSTPDLVGIHIRAVHKSITGVLPSRTVAKTVVVPIEAQRATDA